MPGGIPLVSDTAKIANVLYLKSDTEKILQKKFPVYSKTAEFRLYVCAVNEDELFAPLKGKFFSP